MYDYSDGSKRGTTPYIAPHFIIHENKKFVYDDVGNIRAITDIETEYSKNVRNTKKKLVIFVLIMLLISWLICTSDLVISLIQDYLRN